MVLAYLAIHLEENIQLFHLKPGTRKTFRWIKALNVKLKH